MLGIPLSEKFEKNTRFGRWARKVAGISGLISGPLVIGTHVASEAYEQKMVEAHRQPISLVVEVPNRNIKELIGLACDREGKKWTDFISIGIKPMGAKTIVKAVAPCLLGKLR
jgi:hypothetical protein